METSINLPCFWILSWKSSTLFLQKRDYTQRAEPITAEQGPQFRRYAAAGVYSAGSVVCVTATVSVSVVYKRVPPPAEHLV